MERRPGVERLSPMIEDQITVSEPPLRPKMNAPVSAIDLPASSPATSSK